jgi:hypothetical protein
MNDRSAPAGQQAAAMLDAECVLRTIFIGV